MDTPTKMPLNGLALAVLALSLLAACASGSFDERESVVRKNDAIADFITVAELEQVDEIRSMQQWRHKEITERYIIIRDNRHSYLAAFTRRCHELSDTEVTPDYRSDLRKIRARFDTFRGCRIDKLYKLSEGQAKELQELGAISGQQTS